MAPVWPTALLDGFLRWPCAPTGAGGCLSRYGLHSRPGALEGTFPGTLYGVTSQALFSGITNLYGVGTFTASNSAVAPGGTVAFTVQRVNGSSGAVQLDYSTQDGTAIRGNDYVATQGTLSWADGDTTPRTVVVNCNPTASPEHTFNLNLALPRGGIQLGLINQATVTVQYNYTAGAAQQFTAQQLTNAAISGLEATPAGDGVANLLKYALGLAPFTPASNKPPAISLTGGRLRMVFNRDPLKTDLTYTVQASDALNPWIDIASSTTGNPTANLGAFSVLENPTNSLFSVTVDDLKTVDTTPRVLPPEGHEIISGAGHNAVSARTREIATLRALGFGRGSVVVSVMIESLALALIGGLIGAALAYLFFNGHRTSTMNVQSFSQVSFAFAVTPALLVKGITWAAIIGVVGGIFPAVRAARLPIASALRELDKTRLRASRWFSGSTGRHPLAQANGLGAVARRHPAAAKHLFPAPRHFDL